MNVVGKPEPTPQEALAYAPVLQRMVEMMGSKEAEEEGLTFSVAMARAAASLGIAVPDHMEGPLLLAAFRIITGGKFQGAPDA